MKETHEFGGNWTEEKLKKTIAEREILYPIATQKIEIDLDDGVKVNYPKFGKALKKVPGFVVFHVISP
jgi:hypothetical protein